MATSPEEGWRQSVHDRKCAKRVRMMYQESDAMKGKNEKPRWVSAIPEEPGEGELSPEQIGLFEEARMEYCVKSYAPRD
ncbi:MAG: hypothetical protein ACKO2G_12105 [Verrucomicrobiales bacterium]